MPINISQILAKTDILVREQANYQDGHQLRSTQVIALAKALVEEFNRELAEIRAALDKKGDK
jgi:hypothetical protein